VGGALSVLFERLPERLLRVLSLHFEKPSPHETADVVALLTELPDSLLEGAVSAAEEQALVRLPGPTLTATRKLLHRAVSAGGAVGRRAYPLLADLEQKLSAARRA
jgi:hypothetical protein